MSSEFLVQWGRVEAHAGRVNLKMMLWTEIPGQAAVARWVASILRTIRDFS